MSNNLTNANDKSDNAKRSPLKLSTVKVSETQKLYAFKSSSSENSIKVNNKQVSKKVSQVKVLENDQQIVEDLGGLTLDAAANKSSLDYLDLKTEGPKTVASLSAPSLEKPSSNTLKSSTSLCESKPGSSSQNSLKWDQNRRNRKEYKRKNKKDVPKTPENLIPAEGRENVDEPRKTQSNEESINHDDDSAYKFKYFPKNTKSVVFTKDVLVVYFNGEDIVNESREPLKKEIEQQQRNKEMRKTHLIKTQEKYNLCLF